MDAIKEQWEALPQWQKIAVVVFFTLLIMYGIYVMYIEPQKNKEKRLQQEVATLKTQVDRLKRFARPELQKKLENKLQQINTEIKILNKKLNRMKAIIPTKEQTQEILRFISDAVMGSGIALNEFSVSDPESVYMRYNSSKDKVEIVTGKSKTKDKSFIKIKRVKIDLDLSSRNVSNLIMFLRKLGESNRFFSLDNLSIEKISGKKLGGYKIKVIVSTYFM